MAYHVLKTVQPYFDAVLKEEKRFEIRINDRDFRVGDILALQEYDAVNGRYVGPTRKVSVTFIIYDFPGLVPGWCIMSIEKINYDTTREN